MVYWMVKFASNNDCTLPDWTIPWKYDGISEDFITTLVDSLCFEVARGAWRLQWEMFQSDIHLISLVQLALAFSSIMNASELLKAQSTLVNITLCLQHNMHCIIYAGHCTSGSVCSQMAFNGQFCTHLFLYDSFTVHSFDRERLHWLGVQQWMMAVI